MSGLSHVIGANVPLVAEGTIGSWLDAAAFAAPDRLAFVVPWQDVRWTWRELHHRVKAVAMRPDATTPSWRLLWYLFAELRRMGSRALGDRLPNIASAISRKHGTEALPSFNEDVAHL